MNMRYCKTCKYADGVSSHDKDIFICTLDDLVIENPDEESCSAYRNAYDDEEDDLDIVEYILKIGA